MAEQFCSLQSESRPRFKLKVRTKMNWTCLKGFWLTCMISFTNQLCTRGRPFNLQWKSERCYWRYRPSQKGWIFLLIFWWQKEFWGLGIVQRVVLQRSRRWRYLFKNCMQVERSGTVFRDWSFSFNLYQWRKGSYYHKWWDDYLWGCKSILDIV
jgi:hypothetical protein